MTDAELREYEEAIVANRTSVELRCIVARERWSRFIDGAIRQSIGTPLGVPAEPDAAHCSGPSARTGDPPEADGTAER